MTDSRRTPRPGRGMPIKGAPIEGTVDPRAVEKAREALRLKLAKGTLKDMAGREDGARRLADTLRRWMRD